LKGDAEQLISEAIELLGKASSDKKAKNHVEEHPGPMDQSGKDDGDMEVQDTIVMGRRLVDEQKKKDSGIEEAETDRPKKKSPERSFWYKLAEQTFR